MPGVTRFGVSLEENLLTRFDRLLARKGYANRSEAIRDLFRESLVREQWETGTGEAVGTIRKEFRGKIDILVHNSGGPPAGPVMEMGSDDYLRGFEMHFRTSHDLSAWAIPQMIQSGYGRIVNILSISVHQPIDSLPVSNMIRAGIASWAKTLSNSARAASAASAS